MSGSARRLQRPGHPVAGEQLEGAQAHYHNAKGDTFTVRIDSRAADMLKLYAHLCEIVRDPATKDPADVAEAFAVLDAVAAKSWLQKRRLQTGLAIAALTNVYWLEYHGHLVSNENNGMMFAFSRPNPREPGTRVAMMRPTLDPTPAQEEAFARALQGAMDGSITKVEYDPE